MQSRDTANNIVGMLGSVSGSVLENKLSGEQSSVISSAKLNMAVERSDPDSVGGSSIGDGQAGFQIPSGGKLFEQNLDLDGPVDKQVCLGVVCLSLGCFHILFWKSRVAFTTINTRARIFLNNLNPGGMS